MLPAVPLPGSPVHTVVPDEVQLGMAGAAGAADAAVAARAPVPARIATAAAPAPMVRWRRARWVSFIGRTPFGGTGDSRQRCDDVSSYVTSYPPRWLGALGWLARNPGQPGSASRRRALVVPACHRRSPWIRDIPGISRCIDLLRAWWWLTWRSSCEPGS